MSWRVPIIWSGLNFSPARLTFFEGTFWPIDGIFSPEALLQVLKSAEALYVLGGRLAVFVAVTLLNILDGLLVY